MSKEKKTVGRPRVSNLEILRNAQRACTLMQDDIEFDDDMLCENCYEEEKLMSEIELNRKRKIILETLGRFVMRKLIKESQALMFIDIIYGEKTYQQVSEEFGISRARVHKIFQRIKELLQKMLKNS